MEASALRLRIVDCGLRNGLVLVLVIVIVIDEN